MISGETILSTAHADVGYRQGRHEKVVLTNLSLELRAHSLVCFMGPNGIGKSTLLRTLAGLQPLLRGGVNLPRVEAGKSVAVVLTDRVQTYNMTVRDMVSLGRYPHLAWHTHLSASDDRIVDESIELVQLQNLQHQQVNELSDGQLQMVMIARALAQQTPLLILDEPTAHLDLNNRVEVMNLLRHLARTTGKGILVATHELDLALQTADEIWLATPDKSIRSGIPEDLVLDGSFDDVFQLKGFDLKTGKVKHQPFRQEKIRLIGEGYRLLWTKNALERMGFEVTDDSDCLTVKIQTADWVVDGTTAYESLTKLLDGLTKSAKPIPNIN
ncbi:MAG: ABC transporter ATP-binding protein [Cyclobacteriaceae bacterium]